MAGPSESAAPVAAPPPDAPLIARVDARLGRLEDLLNLLAAVAILAVMVMGIAQIVSRSLFNGLNALTPAIPRFAIHGYIDYVQFIAAFYGLLGLAYCQRVGGHIRMEVALASMRGRLLWTFETLATLVAIVVTILLIVGTWDNFHNAWSKGDSSMDIKLPLWPAKLLVPAMLAVLLARLLVQLWGYLRMLANPARAPLAVPVPETAEQAAQREIDEALRLADTDARAAPAQGAGR
ncbi:MAG: TRAP transporter small permease [Burkholderiales bacterium]|nr:TRAP transporter small permease [Burkholderiales bacterium]